MGLIATVGRIRLVGGSGPNEGRVEVRPEDSFTWGTVCDTHFDMRDADVVCRMLGYLRASGFNELAEENQGNGPIFMDDLQCAGNESSLFNCSYADPSRVRLVGGSSENEGRVEVRPDNSFTWGTVCQDQFDMRDADVVCRMLGYPKAYQVRTDANFGQDTIRIRLTGGSGPDEGRVEVRQDGGLTWGTVCQDYFDMRDADVVCRMLGFPSAQAVRNDAFFGQAYGLRLDHAGGTCIGSAIVIEAQSAYAGIMDPSSRHF
ncbi:scavenger receptor cysteine-rich domain superfamily protein-like [Branchiostoma floridae]|uniref:Scavenger receptor cysteine-rich domain superfamily protein-like n=1 Tax=Branchiostoma floridae TaxID=7739 RepID=A0A9J7KZ80_BRAFL|nr:scavenger receptor cysteine-rich domain superfamily protein-like [Branchiostoma floridae]